MALRRITDNVLRIRIGAFYRPVRRRHFSNLASVTLPAPWQGTGDAPLRLRENGQHGGLATAGQIVDANAGANDEIDTNLELMLRVSRLIEDDPALAAEFARTIEADGTLAKRFGEICTIGEATEVRPPSPLQLRQVFGASALPFVGFGILDNAVMIIFGDVIDMTLCTAFGFSTMAAAALGNTLSDGVGVFSGGLVEDLAARFGFKAPPISRAQQEMACTRRWERTGQLCGVMFGCLLGMFPLLFIDWKEQETRKRQKGMEHLYEHVVSAVEDILQAEVAMIMLVDDKSQELYTCSAAYHEEGFQHRCKVGEGIMGWVARTGEFLNIADVRAPESQEYYKPAIHDNFMGKGIRVQSVLGMPVFGYDAETNKCDKVVGVVEVLNKRTGGHFSEWDEDALAAVCSHVSSSLSFIRGEEHGFDETLERCATALRCKGARISPAQNRRVHDLYVSVLRAFSDSARANHTDLFSIDTDKQEYKILASSMGSLGHRITDPEGHSLAGTGLKKMTELKQPCFTDGGMGISCPIFDWRGNVIGAIQTSGKDGREPFSQEDASALEEVSRRVSLTMEGPGSSLAHLLQEIQDKRTC